MKVSELRIGNKVYIDDLDINTGKWHKKIDEISHRDIYNLVHGHDMIKESYEGIPLTRKWLSRFCSVKNPSDYYCYLHFDPRMSIRFYNFNSAECDIMQDDKYISLKCAHIKYVHELQNLFFALSGTELQDINIAPTQP